MCLNVGTLFLYVQSPNVAIEKQKSFITTRYFKVETILNNTFFFSQYSVPKPYESFGYF